MIIPVILLAAYCMLVMILIIGWKKAIAVKAIPGNARVKNGISILVACRNEAKNIPQLINALSRMNYPMERFEVILVNDHSSDETTRIIKEEIGSLSNFKLIELTNGIEGKKAALNLGIEHAKFELIATTDGDCIVPIDWLSYLSLFFEEQEAGMLVGGVKLTGDSFFSQLQAMEFSSLLGSTGAAIALGHPVMSNGANLAFRKEWFKEVSGYNGNYQIASGDDEFLMRKIIKRYPQGLRFIHYGEAAVSTRAQGRFFDFISQRLRWAGKWKSNPDAVARILAVMVVASQIAFVTLIIAGQMELNYSIALIAAKQLFEFIFIFGVTRFLKTKFYTQAFLALQFIYPIYVILIGFLSLTGSYHWKGRNYNR